MGILVPGTTSWTESIPALLVAVALLFVPGVVAALLMRMRLVAALAVGPALSTSCLGISGIVAPLVGLRWGLLPLGIGVAAMWVAAFLFGTWAQRREQSTQSAHSAQTAPSAPAPEVTAGTPAGSSRAERLETWWRSHGVTVATLTGLAIAFVIYLLSILGEIPSPEAFPQHPDTIFHLAAPQWMLENGTISSLSAGRYNVDTWSGFYPAALYGFTATITLVTGVPIVVSTSVFVIVIAGLAWPLGCMVLAMSLLGRRPVVALSSAIASVVFTGFPYFLMGFGVLWPNLFGGALLPVCLAALVAALGSRSWPRYALTDRPRAIALLVVSLPGLVMAHPNAFVSFCVLGAVCVVGRLFGWGWGLRDRPVRAVAVLGGAAALAVLGVAVTAALRRPSMFVTGAPGPEASAARAWYAVANFAPRSTNPLTLLSIVVVVGVVAVLWRHRGARWVVAALAILLGLFWLNVAVDAEWTRYLTWPWYNNAVRIQAVAVLPAVILASAGFVLLADLLAKVLTFRGGRAVAAAVVVVAFGVATHGGYLAAHLHILHRYFHPKAADSWASDREIRALRTLSAEIPADAVVAANPWNGATYLYVVSGRRLLVPTEKTNFPGDRQLLSKRLDQVGTDPEVCAAAKRQNVEWAITGGRPFSWAQTYDLDQFTGVNAVGSSSAWQKVKRVSPYTLYKRVACAT